MVPQKQVERRRKPATSQATVRWLASSGAWSPSRSVVFDGGASGKEPPLSLVNSRPSHLLVFACFVHVGKGPNFQGGRRGSVSNVVPLMQTKMKPEKTVSFEKSTLGK